MIKLPRIHRRHWFNLDVNISTVRLGSYMLSTGAVFSAFGARLPVFPPAHFAKIAKLALSGLKQGNFYVPLAGKNFGHLTISRRKTAPDADFGTAQKTYRTLLRKYRVIFMIGQEQGGII